MQFGDVTLRRQGLEEWLFYKAMKIAIANVGRANHRPVGTQFVRYLRMPHIEDRCRFDCGHHFGLTHQQCNLDNKNRRRRSGDSKQRLRDPHGKRFVCHGILQLLIDRTVLRMPRPPTHNKLNP
jgi:hypothetical protein